MTKRVPKEALLATAVQALEELAKVDADERCCDCRARLSPCIGARWGHYTHCKARIADEALIKMGYRKDWAKQ